MAARSLIIQGKHSGEMFTHRGLPLYWDIPVPPKITVAINPELDSVAPKFDVVRYKLTFRSLNGEWGLYTECGEPDAILQGRDWLVSPHPLKKPQPIYSHYQPPPPHGEGKEDGE